MGLISLCHLAILAMLCRYAVLNMMSGLPSVCWIERMSWTEWQSHIVDKWRFNGEGPY